MSTEQPKVETEEGNVRETSPAEDSGGHAKSEDAKPEADAKSEDAKPESVKAEEPPAAEAAASPENGAAQDDGAAAWPPREAAPDAEAAPADKADRGAGSAALPAQEMGFSESTQHWLEDGELITGPRITSSTTIPSYDPTEPVAGRRRTIFVVGGAAVVALIIAGVLYLQGGHHGADEAAPASAKADPAAQLTRRAEAAFAANRQGEALDLARLALDADARYADAHFVVAGCQRARGQKAEARDEYRKYLELAPLGVHAADARAALATLPQ